MASKKVTVPPLGAAVERALANPNRAAILEIWSKAADRLQDDDLDGALTAAKSLIEAVCKLALKETKIEYSESMEVTKLYSLSAKALGISAAGETAQSLKSIFGAAATLVRSVAEMRNHAGDAHGRAEGRIRLPYSQAELAVNVAGAVSVFLMTAVEGYVRASKSLDRAGNVVLKFDKSQVWRLCDHAQNAPKSLPSYGQRKPKPALWLVGDAGVYLMSNGSPPMAPDGRIFNPPDNEPAARMTALAAGCDPQIDALENWWAIHCAIDGGNDFSIVVPLKQFQAALGNADREVVVLVGKNQVHVMSDRLYLQKDLN